ncbi:MAG TPA: chromosomal replication initiator protein DnaA [Solirubrobacteraceae bacterium]|nr:chromosomal replication initiator protein DnaA [Solirubrobacteraceae bacterium]
MDPQLEYAWPLIRADLCRRMDEALFGVWLEPLRPRSLDGLHLVLEAPETIRAWVADRFGAVLHASVTSVLGPRAQVEVVAAHAGRGAPAAPPAGRNPSPVGRRAEVEGDTLNPKLTFDQFVIGDANRFAHAAALAVAELPAEAYNPLFLYRPPGVGKTHLLQAIANYLHSYDSGLAVRYVTVEAFTNAFLAALQAREAERFKQALRGVDVLLVDDVQFLERKARTEEEFFHTFDALHRAGAQLVVTSDRTPGNLGGLEERLRERFGAGLVADIAAPDHAQRLAVLRKRADHDGVRLDDDGVLDVIAGRITDNVRALEGALIRVVAYHSLTGRPVDAATATEVLDGLYGREVRTAPPAITVEHVQALTAQAFGVPPDALLSTDRSAAVAWTRQVAMFLAREHTGQSLPAIGRHFGGRTHTTVLNACRRVAQRLEKDAEARKVVDRLRARLTDPAG